MPPPVPGGMMGHPAARVLVDVGEAVDGLPREVRGGGAEVSELGIEGRVEGDSHHVDGGLLELVVPVDEGAVVAYVPAMVDMI